jgi:hypothetical protein
MFLVEQHCHLTVNCVQSVHLCVRVDDTAMTLCAIAFRICYVFSLQHTIQALCTCLSSYVASCLASHVDDDPIWFSYPLAGYLYKTLGREEYPAKRGAIFHTRSSMAKLRRQRPVVKIMIINLYNKPLGREEYPACATTARRYNCRQRTE